MAITLTALALSAALAGAPPAVADIGVASDAVATSAAASPRMLMICGRDDASLRSFKRKYGRAVFVTAQEAVDAQADGQRWSAPRCITAVEFTRLQRMTSALTYADASSR